MVSQETYALLHVLKDPEEDSATCKVSCVMLRVVTRVGNSYYVMLSYARHWSKGFTRISLNSHDNSMREVLLICPLCSLKNSKEPRHREVKFGRSHS